MVVLKLCSYVCTFESTQLYLYTVCFTFISSFHRLAHELLHTYLYLRNFKVLYLKIQYVGPIPDYGGLVHALVFYPTNILSLNTDSSYIVSDLFIHGTKFFEFYEIFVICENLIVKFPQQQAISCRTLRSTLQTDQLPIL